MQAKDSTEIVADLARAFSLGIKLTCNCTFPRNYIADIQLTCQNEVLIVTGKIIGTQEKESAGVLDDFEMWLSSRPTITAKGEELKLVQNESPENHFPGYIIIGVAAGVLIALVLAVLVAIVVVWYRQR